MQRLSKVTLAPAAAVDNTIAANQALGGAGNFNLNGAGVVAGVATFPIARAIYLHSAADDSAKTFTVTGTDRYGRALVEAVKGTNAGDAITLNDFLTVSQVASDAATAGNVKIGTGATVRSQWIPVDRIGTARLGIQVDPGAGVTYSVEQTNDDPFTPGIGVQPAGGVPSFYLTPAAVPNMSAKNAQAVADIASDVAAVRLVITAGAAATTMKLAPSFMRGT